MQKNRAFPFSLLLFLLLFTASHGAAQSNAKPDDLLIFYSNNIHGELEACG
ncbi:MAG: hypothetical protein ABFS19_01610 [Thermodesulfobacteriota bacterium]